jgi:hypothetical protein
MIMKALMPASHRDRFLGSRMGVMGNWHRTEEYAQRLEDPDVSYDATINADTMMAERLRAELMTGYEDMKQGNAQEVFTAFAKFRETHR